MAAVRRLAYEAADAGQLSPDLGAGIRRVKGAKKFGVRMGEWLTAELGKRMLGVFDRNASAEHEFTSWSLCCWAADYAAQKWLH
ncbi:MAG: hypothetical protein U0Q18_37105 [Bryobacteraceae bacterium]